MLHWLPILTLLIMLPISPPTLPASEWFTVPDGPLPFNLPIFPSYTLETPTISVEFAEMQHTAGYSSTASSLTSLLGSAEAEFDRLADVLTSFVGAEGPLPGMTAGDTGDWSTTTSPTGEAMSAYDYAAAIGGSLGTAWSWGRAVISVNVGSSATLYTLVLLNVGWIVVVNVAIFAIRIFDFFTSLMDKLASVVNVLTGPFT